MAPLFFGIVSKKEERRKYFVKCVILFRIGDARCKY